MRNCVREGFGIGLLNSPSVVNRGARQFEFLGIDTCAPSRFRRRSRWIWTPTPSPYFVLQRPLHAFSAAVDPAKLDFLIPAYSLLCYI